MALEILKNKTLRTQLLTVKGMSAEQPQCFWLRENLHLHNKSYMKNRAPFPCQPSYSGYSYLLSGILPSKNRKFFIQFANYICHVQAAQSNGEHSEACELNSLLEDGQLCSRSRRVAGFNNT